jgi:hypothetical protein
MKSSTKTVVTLELSVSELKIITQWGHSTSDVVNELSVREGEILHELDGLYTDIQNVTES